MRGRLAGPCSCDMPESSCLCSWSTSPPSGKRHTHQRVTLHAALTDCWPLQEDEALVFLCYHSLGGSARFTPHTGFKDPTSAPDAPPRERWVPDPRMSSCLLASMNCVQLRMALSLQQPDHATWLICTHACSVEARAYAFWENEPEQAPVLDLDPTGTFHKPDRLSS